MLLTGSSRSKKRQDSVFLQEEEIFIYNTWCWQGFFSSASILQGLSARLCMYCTVVWKSWLQWHYKHTLETTDSLSAFFPLHFVKKNCTNNNIKYLCCWQFTKKSLDFITVQFFSAVFELPPFENNMSAPSELRPPSCRLHAFVCCMVTYYRPHLPIIKRHMQKAPIVQLQFA